MQQRIQTFKPRRGRYSLQQREALDRATYLLALADLPDPLAICDGLPLILEIGFGMGDATLQQAVAHPDHAILAIDVHTPGVGRLLAELEERGISNVRVLEGDALTLLDDLPNDSLAGIRVFFPDPWPKSRHHKRRIITPANLDLMAPRIAPGGFLHFATDWHEYAMWARDAISHHNAFTLLEESKQPAIASRATRPETKFERRGVAAGRVITDLVAKRR